MIRIAISQAAFGAIARTMPFGCVNFEGGADDTPLFLEADPQKKPRASEGVCSGAGQELARF